MAEALIRWLDGNNL